MVQRLSHSTASPTSAVQAGPSRVALRGGQTLASVVDEIERGYRQFGAYSLHTETFFEDPWEVYRWLRDEAPVYHHADLGFYAVSRYDDCVAVHRDHVGPEGTGDHDGTEAHPTGTDDGDPLTLRDPGEHLDGLQAFAQAQAFPTLGAVPMVALTHSIAEHAPGVRAALKPLRYTVASR